MASNQKVLVRQTVTVMKGDKVISTKVIFEKPKDVPIVPKLSIPEPIKKPVTPPMSPIAKERPGFLEPNPVSPGAEALKRFYMDSMRKNQEEYYEWEANQPSTWTRMIDELERRREKYNKKAAWSAMDLLEVEKIDKRIAECEDILGRLEEDDEYYDESE